MSRKTTISCSPFGCIPVILGCAFLWALCFGVTVDGKHYGAGCSCDKGVTVDKGPAK